MLRMTHASTNNFDSHVISFRGTFRSAHSVIQCQCLGNILMLSQFPSKSENLRPLKSGWDFYQEIYRNTEFTHVHLNVIKGI